MCNFLDQPSQLTDLIESNSPKIENALQRSKRAFTGIINAIDSLLRGAYAAVNTLVSVVGAAGALLNWPWVPKIFGKPLELLLTLIIKLQSALPDL